MAVAATDLLTTLDQNIISQLREIVRSDIDFEHLADSQKKILFVAALSAGLKSHKDLYYLLLEHPEYVGLPALTEIERGTATVNSQVIAANLAQYLADKEALETQVNSRFKTRTDQEQKLIQRLILQAVIRRQAELFAVKANEQTQQTISSIRLAANPKNPPLDQINLTSQEIVRSTASQNNITLNAAVEAIAIATITTSVVAGLTNLANSEAVNEIAQIALANNLDTSITKLYRQIEDKVTLTDIPRYDDPTKVQVTPDISLDLTEINLPSEAVVAAIILIPSAPLQDRIENTKKVAADFSTAVLTDSRTDLIMAELNGNITKNQEAELVAALIADGLVTRIAPTTAGAAARRVVDELNPTNPYLNSSVVRIVSQGLESKTLEQKITTDPKSKTLHFFEQNPNVLRQVRIGIQRLENPQFDLGKEVSHRLGLLAAQAGTLPPNFPQPTRPGPLSGFASQYQAVTNRISGFIPGRAGQIFNVVTHPFQAFQGYLGNFIGGRIVGQFKNWLAEKVVSRIASETLKKSAEFILKQGLQQGVKLLAEQGLKRGLQAVAQAANVAPGAGLLLAAAIELVFAVGGKAIEAVSKAVNGIFRSLTGEDFDLRAAVAAPLLFFGGIAGFLGSATAVAASSAAIIVMGSTFVGFILYISVIAVAPIISSIAHLESGQGAPYSVVSGGVIPEGCPFGWSVGDGHITAGPRTASAHHRGVEAIDIGVGLGTPIVSTHNGLALPHQGSNGPYGNYVDVNGTCGGITFTTRYGHMVTTAFEGERPVKQGEVIGYVDSTGNSTGNHVHYEIRGGNLGDINQFLPRHVPVGCDSVAECGSINLP